MPLAAGPARGVQVTVGETFGGQHIAHDDDGGPGDTCGVHRLGQVGEGAPEHLLLRPRRERHLSGEDAADAALEGRAATAQGGVRCEAGSAPSW